MPESGGEQWPERFQLGSANILYSRYFWRNGGVIPRERFLVCLSSGLKNPWIFNLAKFFVSIRM